MTPANGCMIWSGAVKCWFFKVPSWSNRLCFCKVNCYSCTGPFDAFALFHVPQHFNCPIAWSIILITCSRIIIANRPPPPPIFPSLPSSAAPPPLPQLPYPPIWLLSSPTRLCTTQSPNCQNRMWAMYVTQDSDGFWEIVTDRGRLLL